MGPERRRHRPQRTCVKCRRKGDKDGFFRIAGSPGKGFAPDPRGTGAGRGIYLCRDTGCIEEFTKEIGTKKGAARRKMGGSAEVLIAYLGECRAGSGNRTSVPRIRSGRVASAGDVKHHEGET